MPTKYSTCYDCHQKGKDVRIRQCDELLCNACDDVRHSKTPAPNEPNVNKTVESNVKVNGLASYVASLTTPVNQDDPPKNDSDSHVQANGSATPVVDGNSSRCSNSQCSIDNLDEPRCSCTICSKDYHIACTTLKKPPSKSTKWMCPVCKDFHSLLKNLQSSIGNMQHQLNLMRSEQKSMANKHEIICKENNSLKTEVMGLKREISELKEIQTKNEHAAQDPPIDDPPKTLIIGDSMLREFGEQFFDNAEVVSISGAKMLDIFKELNCRTDLNTFKDIIIHCGTNDLSSRTPSNEVMSSLEAAIISIQLVAPATKVHISAMCPRDNMELNLDIQEMNNDFKELSTHLDCGFIDTGLKMTYRDGTADTSQLIDGLHLNRRGLETLSQLYIDCIPGLTLAKNNWSVATRKKRSGRPTSRSSPSRSGTSRMSPSREHVDSRIKSDYRQWESTHRQRNYKNDDYLRSTSRNGGHSRYPRPNSNRYRDSTLFHNNSRDYTGCYNCGMYNHNQSTCYHKDRVRCHGCGRLGHKEQYCKNKNAQH